jgi:hypothetical protein
MKVDLCTFLNQMFIEKIIKQTHGVIVVLPKPGGSLRHSVNRPITLLNVDYKLLARIIA